MSSVIFNEPHTKFIAEFYLAHYDVLGNRWSSSNQERTRLFAELASTMTTKYGKKFTPKQVRFKLKNMKANAKLKLQEVNEGLFSINGEEPDLPQLNEIDSMLVNRLVQEMNSGNPMSSDDDQDSNSAGEPAMPPGQGGHFRRPPPANGRQTNTASFARNQPLFTPPQSLQRQVPFTNSISGNTAKRRRIRVMTPFQQRLSPSKRQCVSNNAKQDNDASSLKALKRTVLLLQKESLENDLQLQAQKLAAVEKFTSAVDEFRRYIAEQRLIARGVDVNNVPVDIPPGMDGISFQ